MAATEIEWATDVWNFVRGCRRVSPGCGGAAGVGGCYAERQAIRHSGPGAPYEGLVRSTKQGPRWTGVGRFVPEKLAEPLKLKPRKNGERRRIFVNSMSDLFFEEFSNEEIAAGFAVMAACPEHDFLILTKRAERMCDWFSWVRSIPAAGANITERSVLRIAASNVETLADRDPFRSFSKWNALGQIWPLPNVWLGVSAEDQQRADERVPLLLECPAAVRWVSAEPLLGPIDFQRINGRFDSLAQDRLAPNSLSWIVVGGESGPGARECDAASLRSIVAQCKRSRVGCFVKQLGATIRVPDSEQLGDVESGWTPFARTCESDDNLVRLQSSKGGDISEWPHDLRVRQFPGEASPSIEAST